MTLRANTSPSSNAVSVIVWSRRQRARRFKQHKVSRFDEETDPTAGQRETQPPDSRIGGDAVALRTCDELAQRPGGAMAD